GNQLGRWRRCASARPGTATGPLPATPADHAAVHDDFDFELFRIFGAASFQRQTTIRADRFSFRQVNELLTSGQVAVIATPGRGLTRWSSAGTLGLGVGGIVQLIGAIAGGLLL